MSDNDVRGSSWVNGVEAWCNIKGAFVSFVREANAYPTLDDVVICTLGVIADPDIVPERFTHFTRSATIVQKTSIKMSLNDGVVTN